MRISDLEGWLRRYGAAWVERDPDAVAALFSSTAKYYETPFDPPFVGRAAIREYWRAVPEGQTDITFNSRVLALAERTGIVHWTATFTRIPGGEAVRLDGVLILEFDEQGACTQLREWWHRQVRSPI